jgi:hypothetical protein
MTGALTIVFLLSILNGMERSPEMSDTEPVGDEGRLAEMETDLPDSPDHEDEVVASSQPEPEEVSDAVLDQ